MKSRGDTLTQKNHHNKDAFLTFLLQDVRTEAVSERAAKSALTHIITAVDLGNMAEARRWFEQGRKLVHEDPHGDPRLAQQ